MKPEKNAESAPQLDETLRTTDADAIETLVTRTGVFRADEIAIARELAEAKCSGSDPSYQFLLLRDAQDTLVGYTCYGEIPLTDKRFDLYWIAVDPAHQGRGLAGHLLRESEARIRAQGGAIAYAETSGTPAYETARRFYLASGYHEAGRFADFYRDGDDKVVFAKKL